jgi:hypothetical protein
MDMLCKSLITIGLGIPTLAGVFLFKSLDSVIYRILTEWLQVTAVTGEFSFDEVPVYAWTQERLLIDAQAVSSKRDNNTDSTLSRQLDSIYLFSWPSWFKAAYNNIFFVTGSLPEFGIAVGTLSHQQSLECYAARNWPHNRQVKLLFPIAFWVLYPLFVLTSVIIFLLFLAKCVCPYTRRCYPFASKCWQEV